MRVQKSNVEEVAKVSAKKLKAVLHGVEREQERFHSRQRCDKSCSRNGVGEHGVKFPDYLFHTPDLFFPYT